MADSNIVKHDQGGINARILAKESKADFRRVEAASLKLKARFASAEGKRLFIRCFSTFQLGSHFISVIARTRMDHGDVGKVEAAIRAQMEKVTDALNQALDGAEALFKANGITSAATYDTVALEVEVGVLSSSGRRYLELIGKLDQLMPLLQTLEIHEVITTQAVDIERAALKRKRDVANGTRNLANRMRRAMNALDSNRQEERAVAPNGDGHAGESEASDIEQASADSQTTGDDGEGVGQGLAGPNEAPPTDESTPPPLAGSA